MASAGLLIRGLALAVVASLSLSACGSSEPPTPEPYTEQEVIAAFRKAGVSIPVVLRSGKSCHPDRWPVALGPESTKAATLYACGRLGEAGIDENLPLAVLLVGTLAPTPDYLISIYADLPDAATLPFWLSTSFKPRRGLPVSALRYSNVVVAGLMTKSDIAASDKAFATLKP